MRRVVRYWYYRCDRCDRQDFSVPYRPEDEDNPPIPDGWVGDAAAPICDRCAK